MPTWTDQVVRAMTDDGAFRVITARTTETVRAAVSAQHGRGQTARYFGDLLTGAILFRETMAPALRVQGIVKSANGGGSLVADSHPSGRTRGLIQPAGDDRVELGKGALLRLMRTLPNGKLNQGVVEVTGEAGISGALMSYMQSSEQVTSMLALGTVMDGNQVLAAGGYMVQLLPEVDRGPLMVMTERLEEFRSIDKQLSASTFTPNGLLEELLHGMPFTLLDENAVGFDCWCSELRVIGALATLSRSDIASLLEDRSVLDISCDYCGKQYPIQPAQLEGLLETS